MEKGPHELTNSRVKEKCKGYEYCTCNDAPEKLSDSPKDMHSWENIGRSMRDGMLKKPKGEPDSK